MGSENLKCDEQMARIERATGMSARSTGQEHRRLRRESAG
jgi:hypothetical protein